MKVLVGCEFSGAVRRAFRRLGHDAWSCDLLPAEDGSPYHIRGDIFRAIVRRRWDLVIFFPPCTHLCCSGARWFKSKKKQQAAAVRFFLKLARVQCRRLAIENPVGIMSSRYRKPDQIIQPWQFGHPETKATCLWLRGLPTLEGTKNVRSAMLRRPARLRGRIHHMPPGPERERERSRTFSGIAAAMAQQWGGPIK